jgi:hypothetical protein
MSNNTKLKTVEDWTESNFDEDSRPKRHTVWRWIREGRLQAVKIGRRYYINPEARIL